MNYVVVQKTLRRQMTFQNALMVDATIRYPQISGGPVPGFEIFNEYYRREAAELVRYARETLYPAAVEQYRYALEQGFPFNNYVLMYAYEITCRSCLLSLYADRYEYTGGAHGLTARTGYTWEPALGKRMALSDLFVAGYDYNAVILPAVEAEARYWQSTGEADYFDGLSENIRAYYSEENYYLSPGGVVIFYPLYTIAPYAAGIQTFTVPYALFMGGNAPRYA